MKKKLLAILVAVAMVMSLLPIASFAAEGDATYGRAYATGHTLGEPRDNVDVKTERTHPEAAYDEPDAEQNGKEIAFYSLRQVEDVTYTFHPSEDLERQIVNYRGDDETTMPDLSLIEVTWGTWHVEAVDVYLTDAVVNGVSVDEYKIGTAFNKAGIDKITAKAPGYENVTLAQSFHKEGNFGYTDIFFPNEVESAMAVKLIDVTTDYNTPDRTHTSYVSADDGYDLDAICAWYTRDIPVTASGTFAVQKQIEDPNLGYINGGTGFAFAAYEEIDAEGNPVDTPVATAETDLAGVATFEKSDNIEPGKAYFVFETSMEPELEAIYQYGAANSKGYIEVVALEALPEDGDMPIFYNDLIPGDGTLIIGKKMGEYVNYSSVTGGYPAENIYKRENQPHNLDSKLGNKGSWFQFNEMDTTSATFDLVTGDKLNKVGDYSISYADGQFTITLNPDDALELSGTAWLSVSNTIQGAKKAKDAANGVIWTKSPGQQMYKLSFENNVAVVKDTANVNFGETVYVYMHLGLAGYVGTYGEPAGSTFAVEVTGPSFPKGTTIDVPMNGTVKLDGLRPGTYTVKEVESGWTATYYVNDGEAITTSSVEVTVTSDEVTTVMMTNEPGEAEISGTFAVQKQLQDPEHGYINGSTGFTFAAYEEIEDGNPVGDPVATAETDMNGVATFDSASIEPNKTYYVFETEMPDELSDKYFFGKADGTNYIEVVAVEVMGDDYDMPTFYNDLKLGTLTVTKKVEAYKDFVFGDNSVTGGGKYSEPHPAAGNNWFRINEMNGDQATFDLVAGRNLIKVGEYSVSYAEGEFAITIDSLYGEQMIEVLVQGVRFNAGNSMEGWSASPGQNPSLTFNGNTATFAAEDIDIKAPIYIYLHTGIHIEDGLTIRQEASIDAFADMDFAFEVRDEADEVIDTFTLKHGESFKLENLEEGDYTVVETTPDGWKTVYSLENGLASVVAGGETFITVTNIMETIEKIV